jgi:hypothetical protein
VTPLTGPRTAARWDVLDPSDRHDAAVRTLVAWMTDHLMRPHPALGRSGAVCPFVENAVAQRTLRAALVADHTVAGMNAVVADAFDVARTLDVAGPARHALVTVFPGLTAYGSIDFVHARHKTRFVEHGLMLGQFYPGCAQPGLWSAEFRPLDAPLPMLVVRHMVSSDYPFLIGRREWLHAYFSRFAPDLPARLRGLMSDSLQVCGDDARWSPGPRTHTLDESAH